MEFGLGEAMEREDQRVQVMRFVGLRQVDEVFALASAMLAKDGEILGLAGQKWRGNTTPRGAR